MPGKVSKNVLRIVAVMFILCFAACFAIINMYGFSQPTFERYSWQVYSVPWVNAYQDIHYNDCRNPYANPVIEYHADTDSWSLMNPELFYSKGNISVVDNEFIIDYTVSHFLTDISLRNISPYHCFLTDVRLSDQ